MVKVNTLVSGLVVFLAAAVSANPIPSGAEEVEGSAAALVERAPARTCLLGAIECTYPGGRCASDCEKNTGGCRCYTNYQPLGGPLQSSKCITAAEYIKRDGCPWYGN